MKLIYLPDSGVYINPAYILYVNKTNFDPLTDKPSYSVKFTQQSGSHSLIISECDLFALTQVEF